MFSAGDRLIIPADKDDANYFASKLQIKYKTDID